MPEPLNHYRKTHRGLWRSAETEEERDEGQGRVLSCMQVSGRVFTKNTELFATAE